MINRREIIIGASLLAASPASAWWQSVAQTAIATETVGNQAMAAGYYPMFVSISGANEAMNAIPAYSKVN